MRKSHLFLPIIFGILASLIITLPHLFGLINLKSNYSPLVSSSQFSYIKEETYTYAPQVQHLLKGYLFGDPYIWEYRESPSPYLGELAVILPITLLSIFLQSVPNAFILSDFIFPFLLFLAIFVGLRTLRVGNKASTMASLCVTLIPFLSLLIPKLTSYGTILTGAWNKPLLFTRTPHPQISDIYLFASLFTFAWFFQNKKAKRILVLAIISGLSLYASVYVSSTIVLASLLMLPKIVKKLKAKEMFTIILIGLILALPLVLNLIITRPLTNSDYFFRFTQEKNFLFPNQLRFIIFAFIFLKYGKNKHIFFPLAMFMVAAAVLVDLHQIILGRDIQGDHWITRVLSPITTMGIILFLAEIFSRFKLASKKALWLFPVLVTAIALFYQYSWIESIKENYKQANPNQSLLREIDKKTEEDAVIGVLNTSISDEIRAVTGRWVYISPGDRSFISNEEQLQRVCDLATLSKNENQKEEAKQALLRGFGLDVANKKKVDLALNKMSECIDNNNARRQFKLDYYVIKGKDGNLQLIKN